MDTWQGDAVSLVEAFRAGDRSPVEELEASLSAIEDSSLNAFSYLDADGAMEAALAADVSSPLGGVPFGVKELQSVEGWPDTQASLVFKDRVGGYTAILVERLVEAGAIPIGMTTASEFGGLNVSVTRLNGVTGNPWKPSQTAGGSSGGSAAAVAGGLVPLATGGDGGGSIRIPSGFNGLPGLKATFGRIPRGPKTDIAPMTVVFGPMCRSVADIARFLDVTAGHNPRDPYSLPQQQAWEAELGSYDLSGLKATIAPSLGVAVVRDEVGAMVEEAGRWLAEETGLQLVDVPVKLPGLGLEWVLANMAALLVELGDLWPGCKTDLTEAIAFGIDLAMDQYDLGMAARVEEQRTRANEIMADLFDQVDFVIGATNPDVAYPAEVSLNTRVGDQMVGPENNGVLTIPSNIVGNPAISIPIGTLDGLPVGMQVLAPHHREGLLLDLAQAFETGRAWPLTAPGAPA